MKKFNVITSLGLIIVMLAVLILPFIQVAQAAAITSASDTMSRVKASTLANHDIQFTSPTGAAAASTITVTFPAGFTMGSVAFGDMDLLDDGVDITLAAACATTTWGAALTGQVITFTSCTGTITAGSVIRIKIGTNAAGGVNQITNPAAGSYAISIGGTFGDSGNITVQILADDQVAVSATVAQSLTFSISDNTIGFGTLSSTASRWATGDEAGTGTADTAAHTMAASTNSGSGYTITVNGNTLTSGANTINPIGAAAAPPTTGTEQYGINLTYTGGSGTATAPYNDATLPYTYAFDTAAFPDEVASSAGASADTTYSVYYVANIAGATEAGSYTSTLTYIATGNF